MGTVILFENIWSFWVLLLRFILRGRAAFYLELSIPHCPCRSLASALPSECPTNQEVFSLAGGNSWALLPLILSGGLSPAFQIVFSHMCTDQYLAEYPGETLFRYLKLVSASLSSSILHWVNARCLVHPHSKLYSLVSGCLLGPVKIPSSCTVPWKLFPGRKLEQL